MKHVLNRFTKINHTFDTTILINTQKQFILGIRDTWPKSVEQQIKKSLRELHQDGKLVLSVCHRYYELPQDIVKNLMGTNNKSSGHNVENDKGSNNLYVKIVKDSNSSNSSDIKTNNDFYTKINKDYGDSDIEINKDSSNFKIKSDKNSDDEESSDSDNKMTKEEEEAFEIYDSVKDLNDLKNDRLIKICKCLSLPSSGNKETLVNLIKKYYKGKGYIYLISSEYIKFVKIGRTKIRDSIQDV